MKRLFFILLLTPVFAASATITRGVYVEDPTQTTATFRIRTSEPTPLWLEYGPSPTCSQIMTLSPEATEHRILVHGLVPNKEFCYRAYVLNEAKDGVQEPVGGKFKTLYTPERKELKFIIFGNTAGAANDESRALLAAKLETHNPDFFIHTGDLVSNGLDVDADHEFFVPFQHVLAKAPMFIAVGEKEYGINNDAKETRATFAANYKKAHTMTWGKGTPNYYYFDSANARVIFLDTSLAAGKGSAPSFAKESEQYKWLRTSLATTESGKWKIVVLHNPLRSTGVSGLVDDEHPKDPVIEQAEKDLLVLLEYYGVNVVLQGHDSNYERTFTMMRNKESDEGEESEKGIVFLTFGTGASEELTKRVVEKPWTARFVSAQVYGEVEIVDRRFSLKVYNMEGKLLDNVDIMY